MVEFEEESKIIFTAIKFTYVYVLKFFSLSAADSPRFVLEHRN